MKSKSRERGNMEMGSFHMQVNFCVKSKCHHKIEHYNENHTLSGIMIKV
jgi:hypothetical protein